VIIELVSRSLSEFSQWLSCHWKANMQLSISEPRSYLTPFSHNRSMTDDDDRQIDRQTNDNSYHKLDHYLSTVS